MFDVNIYIYIYNTGAKLFISRCIISDRGMRAISVCEHAFINRYGRSYAKRLLLYNTFMLSSSMIHNSM